jgi:ActR/RegA family two-component response regulator
MPLGNVLIVEDELDWREIYIRNAHPQHGGALRATECLTEAREAIREMAFAVAFVDIRLDPDDEQNTDGLQVLDLLTRAQDHTSAIMLTGHGTVEITRDAIKEFDAFEALEKAKIEPQRIQALVDAGTSARNLVARVEDARAVDVMRGKRTAWDWDHEMLKITGGKRSAAGLYEFLENLVGPFLPVVGGVESDHVKTYGAAQIALGTFWSRANGQAVVVAFGEDGPVGEALQGASIADCVGSPIGETLRRREKGGLMGFVAALPERNRASFL